MDTIRRKTNRERKAFYGADFGKRDARRLDGSTRNSVAHAEMTGFRSPFQATRMTIANKRPKRYGQI